MSDATSLQQQRWAGAKMKIQVVWNFECPKLALEPPEIGRRMYDLFGAL